MSEYFRQKRKERRAKKFPPLDPTITVRPWTAADVYSAERGRGCGFFFDEPEEEVDTRLPSERMGYKY